MNKTIKVLLFLILLHSTLEAHTLLLNVFNNEDNTIQVEGLFSTGEPADGAQILLKSLINEKILYNQRLPLEGELTIRIPKEDYKIILNGGPGHIIVKEGIAPIGGFDQIKNSKKINFQKSKEENINKINSRNAIVTYGLSVSFLLLLLTMIISIKNTNKIVKTLRENKK